ncbi:ABC transporter ATP-binding protein/permease [Merdimonas faecis]|uniref:ABC transporter ATP-binding protein/permease n=1 Tax=Merdimonas faecis TaxID=1653435 RepID=A0A9D3AIL0_9FIRM|nr:ABC transporter ATP-binding protein/permease [Merdimonas faecis]HJH49504.1 ABC transporter ATP-binding protein/permease [Merdimonas faecis]
MLQIRDICKEYRTGSLVQKALDQVSLNLRDNEFVAILGPSGSGKTTLLNIIGGLDRYDSGDLIINGISTKKYKDRDWDSYRNHTIGFVFQSYNLIPHQTILSNVELALTISGIGKSERRERAKKALDQVGLGEQVHKKPNQLSGGQMQRVAIARALVNDPEILLADEPTGALDSETSVQVMELLKEVARDRLVVMVTHNPELAHEYATRIVNLKDGKIRSDSDPFMVNEQELAKPEHKNMGKASMSFLTALSLSFNNLKTKKARTLLTSFAGSIGIIGIALILALSTGVNDYIKQIEEETLSEYPLQIQSTGVDFSSMIESGEEAGTQEEEQGDIYVVNMVTDMFSTMDTNDLESLKSYLDSGDSGIEKYTNAVEYSYNTEPQIYKENGDEIRQVHPDSSFSSLGLGSASNTNSMMSSMMSTDVFFEMPENEELYEGQYDIKAGRWPENSNECVLVLTQGGAISDFMLYTLGLRDPLELDEMVSQFLNEEDITVPEDMGSYDYDDIIGINFKLVNSADYYAYDSQYQVWTDKSGDHDYVKGLVENGEDLTIVGVVQPSEDANASALSAGICYPASLTKHMSEYAEDTEIVKQQLADPSVNVFTGEAFGEESSENTFDMESLITVDEEKLQEAFGFDESAFSNLSDSFDFSSVFGNAGDSVDLSGMVDLSGINISLPETGTMDLGEMLGNLDISISSEGFAKMAESLMEGYQLYVKDHPEADYSGLLESFQNYLTSDSAKWIMKESVVNIIKESGAMKVSSTELSSLFAGLQNDFAQSVEGQNFEDADEFYSALITFMQGDPAVSAFNNFLEEKLDGVTVSDDQMTALAQEIMKGYYDYAQAGNGPDPSKIGEYFLDYLQTEDAQNRLAEGLAGTVDMGNVESQLTQVVENYMRNAMSSYGNAVSQALSAQISSAMQQMMSQLANGMGTAMSQAMANVGSSLENAMNIDGDAFADAFQMNMTGDQLTELMMSMNSGDSASYENNLATLGYVDFDVPSGIDIYPKDFESKEQVVKILDDYNSKMEEEGKEEQVITYTDVVGTLMSSVTDIIDIISYVLIAFVAISLVVSSIMIGVITYISVLERKKEIGILRAIGASKGNISQVFNAETFIIGFCAGAMGIIISLLLLIPGNALIHYLAGTDAVNAVLPVRPAVILILLSVVLTLIGGLIPSRKAAKSDPVTALRTE